jgi:hypothetical protein
MDETHRNSSRDTLAKGRAGLYACSSQQDFHDTEIGMINPAGGHREWGLREEAGDEEK